MPVSSHPAHLSGSSNPGGAFSTRDVGILILLFIGYVISGRVDLVLMDLKPTVGIVWIPAGISLAVVLLKGRRLLPAVFLGSFCVALMSTVSWGSSLIIASGSTLEVLIASSLVKRFAGGAKAFSRPAHVLRFMLLAGILSTSVGASIGAPAYCHAVGISWQGVPSVLAMWWISHALAVLVLTPFLVLLLDGSHKALQLPELIETAAMLLGLSFVCILSFGPSNILAVRGATALFFCVPFLVWAGIRFCPLEASGACMLLAGFATWGSVHGFGPFAGDAVNPLHLAIYLFMASTMTLTGAATVAKQRQLSEELLATLYRMEQSKNKQIDELKAEADFLRDELIRRVHFRANRDTQPGPAEPERNSSEVIWFLDADTENIIYVSPSYENVWGRPREDLRTDNHLWFDAVIPEDREFAIQFVGQEFPDDRVETSYRIRRGDGSIRWIYDRGFVIRDAGGRPIRLLGLASDITELVTQGAILPAQLERRFDASSRAASVDTQSRRNQG